MASISVEFIGGPIDGWVSEDPAKLEGEIVPYLWATLTFSGTPSTSTAPKTGWARYFLQNENNQYKYIHDTGRPESNSRSK